MGRSSAGHRSHRLRRVFQVAIVTTTAIVGYRMATGRSPDGIEVFCPFGGIETAYSLLGGGRFTCATGSGNLAILIALLLLTLVARKAFCSWVCPVGTIAEALARVGRFGKSLFGKKGWSRAWNRQLLGILTPPPRADRALRWLRFPILVLILVFTYGTGELVFRSFDPYYILFSFHGHDVRGYSYVILGGVVGLGITIPMAWCRYLCPLGGVLWPFSRAGLLRIARNPESCTGCRACDLACPHSIEVSRTEVVHSGECTLCLDCTTACPRATALTLTRCGTPRGVAGPVPRPAGPVTGGTLPGVAAPGRVASVWIVPALVVVFALAGMGAARSIRIPSVVRDFPGVVGTGAPATVRFTLDGVRCVDTSEAAIRQLDELPGVLRATAYAARHEVEVVYDPSLLDALSLTHALEAPSLEPTTGQYIFHRFRVVATDGGVPDERPAGTAPGSTHP